MPKICFLASASSIHTVRWVNSLVENHCEITLLTMDKAGLDKIDSRVNIKILPYKGKKGYYLNAIYVRRILSQIKPDIVHAHYASGYGTLNRLSGYFPSIVSIWGSDVYLFPKQGFINKKVLIKNLNFATQIASTSYDMKNEAYKYINKKKDIHITPFGIDTNRFSSNRIEDKKDGFHIGIVKRLEKVYGVEYLIQALPLLKEKLTASGYEDLASKIKLSIVGDGSLKNDLKSLSKDLKVDNQIEFVGNVPNEDVPKYLNLFDVYCAPSLSESFGVAVLEASSCSIPVIASKVGGLPEVIVNEKTGYLVEPKNSLEIAEKLYCLATNPKLRLHMGENGRKFVVENYSWDESIERMLNLYDVTIKTPAFQNNFS